MPKKRHQAKYSKPQSTVPSSLVSTNLAGSSSIRGSSSNVSSDPFSPRSNPSSDHDGQSPTVNELLAGMRRAGVSSNHSVDVEQIVAPSVPPVIRDLLRLPVTPAPRPRQPQRLPGRRLPAGPAPPQSWLSLSRHAPRHAAQEIVPLAEEFERHALPDAYVPVRGTLIDVVLRQLAHTWDFQREYWQYYLWELPTHIKVALINYLGVYHPSAPSLVDLQILLRPPVDETAPEGEAVPSADLFNEDFHFLDLTGCLGRSLRLSGLSSMLFAAPQGEAGGLQESWDAPEIGTAVPKPLLPHLTHLSLAIDPHHSASASWRHLLSFVARMTTLTHLSLAYWPEPTLTPNAKFASVVTAQGHTIQYGGTGPYSHSLDGDWSEAISVLRRLSKCLYRLEYLDLTGCTDWCPALFAEADHDTLDWVGNWGKITTLLLYPGHPIPDESLPSARRQYRTAIENAERVEKHIRSRRAGRGRFITVSTDVLPEAFSIGTP